MNNADVTAVVGFHPNYVLIIFKRVMNVPPQAICPTTRLLGARGMLMESDAAITTIAVESGFGSSSQFYAHFSAAYCLLPNQLRRYLSK